MNAGGAETAGAVHFERVVDPSWFGGIGQYVQVLPPTRTGFM